MDGKSSSSVRRRISIFPSPNFTPSEFRFCVSLACQNGLVDAGDASKEIVSGGLAINDWELKLTLKGWEYVEDHDFPIIHRWFQNLIENIPSIVVSVVTAVMIGFVVRYLGWI